MVTLRRIALLAGAVALFYLGYLALWAYGMATAALDLRRVAAQVVQQGRPTAEALSQAEASMSTLRQGLEAMDGALSPLAPALSGAGWAPGIGPELAAAPGLLALGVAAAQAGDHGLRGLAPALRAWQQGDASPAMFLEALEAGSPELNRAQEAIARLRERRAAVGDVALLGPALRAPLEQLDGLLPDIEGAVGLAVALPRLAGLRQPQTYLLLGQNNDELRATGGFIGTAGLLTLHLGELVRLDYRDSYAFDAATSYVALPPPAPYQRYMLMGVWRLRDSNWWADFPTSARQAEAFLWHEQGEPVDGVLAYDQTLLEMALRILGPVDVPAFEERVDATNFMQIIEVYAHPPGYKEDTREAEDLRKVVLPDRKAFVRELADALLERAKALEPGQWLRVAEALRTSLREKHLLLYFHEPSVAQPLAAVGWDGGVRPPAQGDFLLVVETNVGYSKANRYVGRTVDYQLRLGPDAAPAGARVTVTYRNGNSAPARHCSAEEVDFYTADDSCYKSYLRVYVPSGSIPAGATGLSSALEWFSEGEATVLAGLVVLPPGETRQVEFAYVPPREITAGSGQYQLTLLKQPGVEELPTTVTLVAPEGGDGELTPRLKRQVVLRRDERLTLPLP